MHRTRKTGMACCLAAALICLPGAARAQAEAGGTAERLLGAGSGPDEVNGVLAELQGAIRLARSESALASKAGTLVEAREHLQRIIALSEGGDGMVALTSRAASELQRFIGSEDVADSDRTDGIHAIRSLENAREWLVEMARHARFGIAAPDVVGARLHAGHTRKWVARVADGYDDNHDGSVSWREGGVETAAGLVLRIGGGPAE